MEHFYKNIKSEDWFDYQNIYANAVARFPSGSHFVEVGTWKGMSACFMAVEIINSGKEILFDCIDTWEHPEISLNSSEINADSTESYEIFLENIEPVKHIINVLKKNSWEIVETYKDESLDFVFIDARHDYLSVRKDLQVWFPKIKPGGIIAGHDYYINMGVFPAVHEFFQNEQNVEQHGNSWLVVKR